MAGYMMTQKSIRVPKYFIPINNSPIQRCCLFVGIVYFLSL